MKRSAEKQEELFYLISPPQTVVDFVAALKALVEDTLGHPYEDRFSRAHVSLLKDKEEHAESFLYDAEERMQTVKPFIVPIKNIKVFWDGNDQRTIYLDILYKTPICEIFEILTRSATDFNPHIPIAQNLPVNDFLKVWKGLKDISYSYDFQCDHVTVLRKSGVGWTHHVDLWLAKRR